MSYSCSICGREKVKLWHNVENTFCICASCAEKRQVPIKYPVYKWVNKGNTFFAIPIKTESLQWEVNSRGKIPTSDGFDPYEAPLSVTENLTILWEGMETEVFPFLDSLSHREWVNLPTR